MPESYSPAYLVDHLALRAGCPPRRVWFVLYELYWIAEEWADAVDPLTSDQAAEVERVLWEELDDALEREYAPDFTPRRPIGQRVFTPALACTIPKISVQIFTNSLFIPILQQNASLAIRPRIVHNKS